MYERPPLQIDPRKRRKKFIYKVSMPETFIGTMHVNPYFCAQKPKNCLRSSKFMNHFFL